jgi:hypothetical protein
VQKSNTLQIFLHSVANLYICRLVLIHAVLLSTREGVSNERHYLRWLFRSWDRISSDIGLWHPYRCAMTYNNDNYYQPDDDNYSFELQERVYDMVKTDPEYDPSDMYKWGEALQETCKDVEVQAFLRDCIEKKDWEKLGRKLYYLSVDYQEKAAEYYLT